MRTSRRSKRLFANIQAFGNQYAVKMLSETFSKSDLGEYHTIGVDNPDNLTFNGAGGSEKIRN
jgi:hypothetical protein